MAGPPPGAGIFIPKLPPVSVAGEAAGLAELIRWNQDFLAGDASVVAVDAAAVSFFFEVFFSVAGDAAGLSVAVAAVSFFLEDFFFSAAGDAAGLSAAAGDGSFLAECLCLAGEAAGLSAGEGLCANTATLLNARIVKKTRNLFIVAGS
jgi:hypothetical protein